MPANLTPQYIGLRTRFQQSKDDEEKAELLQEMIAIIPKHKGTNKMLAELRSKLATLRKEALNKPSKHKAYNPYRIVRQGAGQVVVIGFPNVGKSKLVSILTKVHTLVASYPFTTDKPIVGMMPFENINIQLIDTPPITEENMEPNLIDLIRRVDLVLLVVDASGDESLEQIEFIKGKLEHVKLKLVAKHAEEDDEEETEFIYKKVIIVANKTDLEGSQDRIETLNELYSQEMTIIGLSAETNTEFDTFKKMIFDTLDIIRVYTKPIGKKPDLADPVILYRGSTVVEAAEEIHKDFAEKLKFAKVWGGGSKYNGQSVSRDHSLEDGNIVEFHVPE
jgi:small GTP-binding protein